MSKRYSGKSFKDSSVMKKLYRIMWDKLDTELDRFEIKQDLDRHEQRKRK